MNYVLAHKKIGIFIFVFIVGGVLLFEKMRDDVPTWVTTVAETGDVADIVSVSGVLRAENEAVLAFPVSGTVSTILVSEGDTVAQDQILATLEQSELTADKEAAYGDLIIAEANRTEAESGPREEARTITKTNLASAEANLDRTITEETKKIENAYRTLLAADLVAWPNDPQNDDIPPIVTGTYSCSEPGVYELSVFRSGAKSGYSYRLDGLESGIYDAFTDAPAPFGTCGLSLQFSANASYGVNTWQIDIPNTRGASYVTNLNAYELAKKQAENAIATAEEALTKAKAEGELENAAPRSESASRLDAAVIQAQARLLAIEARLADRILKAPFAGVVSRINIEKGEVAPAEAITIVADTRYELTVRIPEIDITHIAIGQKAEIFFDARPQETIEADVDFISKTATEIDGVAYFEAKVHFDNPPSWFRSGLNADVNIVVDSRSNVTKLPKRFITQTESGGTAVLVPISDRQTSTIPVTVTFTGNDGFVAIDGLTPGTTVIAP